MYTREIQDIFQMSTDVNKNDSVCACVCMLSIDKSQVCVSVSSCVFLTTWLLISLIRNQNILARSHSFTSHTDSSIFLSTTTIFLCRSHYFSTGSIDRLACCSNQKKTFINCSGFVVLLTWAMVINVAPIKSTLEKQIKRTSTNLVNDSLTHTRNQQSWNQLIRNLNHTQCLSRACKVQWFP